MLIDPSYNEELSHLEDLRLSVRELHHIGEPAPREKTRQFSNIAHGRRGKNNFLPLSKMFLGSARGGQDSIHECLYSAAGIEVAGQGEAKSGVFLRLAMRELVIRRYQLR